VTDINGKTCREGLYTYVIQRVGDQMEEDEKVG